MYYQANIVRFGGGARKWEIDVILARRASVMQAWIFNTVAIAQAYTKVRVEETSYRISQEHFNLTRISHRITFSRVLLIYSAICSRHWGYYTWLSSQNSVTMVIFIKFPKDVSALIENLITANPLQI